MMYSADISTAEVVKKQVSYKWRAYISVFTSLVVIQLLAVLFSLNGTGMSSSGGMNYNIRVEYYNADMIMIFTIFWGFITALLLTTKAYREDDFAFVTNRTSGTLSTIIYLWIICSIAGFAASLSGYLLKVVVFLFTSQELLSNNGAEGAGIYVMGLVSLILTIFMFAGFGYAAGMIVQWNKMFVILLPVLFIGLLISLESAGYSMDRFFFQFLFSEQNFWLFIMKSLAVSTAAYVIAFLISNRLEVKR
ncbi:hypothetical protein [Halobacillus kuroshimensis]|uniref:hypothetical protein n=1 Tax=Halobacillus kuroshimensis TaxID=302481 RepID=UPI0012EB4E51|nr:hypothetical protein [Halobacillus kuroshimensis]